MTMLPYLSFFSLIAALTSVGNAAAFGAQSKRVFLSTPVSKFPKKLVEDCMSPATHVVRPDMSIDETMSMLLETGLSGAPVVDDQSRLVGIVTSFDFLQQEAFEGALLNMEGSVKHVEMYVDAVQRICGQNVEDIMSPNPATVHAKTPMRVAAALMTEKKLHRLPVVEEESGRLVGVLTSSDVMRDLLHVVRNLPAAKDDGDQEENREKVEQTPSHHQEDRSLV